VVGGAEGQSDRRRTPDVESRVYDDIDSAEVCCVAGRRLDEREKHDLPAQTLCGREAGFRRLVLLGPRLLCIDGRTGLRSDIAVRTSPETRRLRRSNGTDEMPPSGSARNRVVILLGSH
jgi:hypothetical protein